MPEVPAGLGDVRLDTVAEERGGRVVAVLLPPDDAADAIRQLHGFMRGSVVVPPEINLTEPACDEPFAAEDGNLHG